MVKGLVGLLQESGVAVGGFVTTELRGTERRVGFVVRDLDGHEATLAHQDYVTGVQVGRFGVDIPAFERVALPALRRALDNDRLVVIDEIARMELASAAFVEMLETVMAGNVPVLGTIHIHKHPVSDALRRRSDVELVTVTGANREGLPSRLLARIRSRP